jgi:hypothetical protein
LSTTLELERAALTFVRYLDFEPKIQTPMTWKLLEATVVLII